MKKRGSVQNGKVAVTGAGDLKSKGVKYIFHAVGPIWMKVRTISNSRL